ncbi:MAG: anti-sigma factor [Actinobacteria bacterium]|nr:anti-sigma factor [Actinomycetota bacterium]
MISLGEPATTADEAHLRDCARCRTRLEQLTAVVASARALTDSDHPVAPPPAVWTAIAAELARDERATVTPITSARRSGRSRLWLVAAAAAAVGVLAGGTIAGGLLGDRDVPELVAQAELAPVDDSGYSGQATIERGSSGNVLNVSVPDLPLVADGYYEVWMATADTSTMVAIGTLNPGHTGSFALPDGMDVNAFPVVDVSVEHFDGNAEHSVTSVVRGQLPV